MNTHTHLLADRIAAHHHDDLIRSAAQRNLAADRQPHSDRRRIALPIVVALRGAMAAAAASAAPRASRSRLSPWQH